MTYDGKPAVASHKRGGRGGSAWYCPLNEWPRTFDEFKAALEGDKLEGDKEEGKLSNAQANEDAPVDIDSDPEKWDLCLKFEKEGLFLQGGKLATETATFWIQVSCGATVSELWAEIANATGFPEDEVRFQIKVMGGRAITVDDPIDDLEGLFSQVITFDRAK